MAKSRYEKLENRISELMKEENLHLKIDDLKQRKAKIDQELSELNNLSLEEISVKGNKYKSKEEYENDLRRREDERDDELLEKIDPLLKEQKKLEKEIKTYESFRANKNEIYNIMEYQKALQEKLEDLNKELESAKAQSEINQNILEEYKKVQDKMEELNDPARNGVNRIDEINEELKGKDLTESERNKLIQERQEIQNRRDKDNEEYIKLTKVQKPNLENNLRSINEISKDINNVEHQIDECNAVWTCLFYGRSWEEIKSVLTNLNTNKENRGPVYKIGQRYTEPDIEKTQELNIEEFKRAYYNGVANENSQEEINEEKINDEKETELPIVYEPFEKKHPILAKIPFISKLAKKKYNEKYERMIKKSNNNDNTKVTEKEAETEQLIEEVKQELNSEILDNDNLKYIDLDRDSLGVLATIKNIAKKGYEQVAIESSKKTKKDRLEDKINYKNKENKFKEGLKVEGVQTLTNAISEVNSEKTQNEVNRISEEVKNMVYGEEK